MSVAQFKYMYAFTAVLDTEHGGCLRKCWWHYKPGGLCHGKIIRNGIHQIIIRTLSGFRYLCQQLAYLVISRIFLIASKIGRLLGSYQEFSA
jgi:hypothetical protein